MVEDKVRREDTEATATVRCEECEGEGYIRYEVPVIDYYNGGFLDERTRRCEECLGDGFV